MPANVYFAFTGGALSLGFLVIALFFLHFWMRARDALFLIFAAAFCLLAANQALPILLGIPREEAAGVYLLRAAGFALIIVAVLVKNLGERKTRS